MLGIADADSEDQLNDFRDALGITFPILVDTNGEVDAAWAVTPEYDDTLYPQEYVVDAQGNIVFISNSYDPEALQAVLDELL